MAELAPVERGKLVKIKDEIVYYKHQADGIRDLARRGSFLLADDMGLGKSIQALTVAAIDFELGKASRILIVAPASLKWNWAAEIDKFTHFTYQVLDGTPKQRQKQLDEFDADILIVNYEQVTAHLSTINGKFFDIAIFDEAHYIKSRNSARSKSSHGILVKRAFLLTGSPMLNHVDDLWSLLHRIDPAEYPSYYGFVSRYGVFGGYKDKQLMGVKNHEELAARVGKVMLRRLKKDVLDLPDKLYIPILVELSPEQKKVYRQANDELMITLPDSPDPMELENALTKFLRLKQICGTTATIEGYEDHSAKLDLAVEKIVEIIESGERVVVFTQFRAVQACLVARLAKRKPEPVRSFVLNGDTPIKDRVDVVNAWAAAPPSAMVAMLQVAAVGLNMTAASKCIFLDKLWVPKLNEQAEDRLHRIGADETKPIEIIQLIARDTVEQRVEAIIRRKKKLFNTIVEDDGWRKKLYTALTEEES